MIGLLRGLYNWSWSSAALTTREFLIGQNLFGSKLAAAIEM